MIKVYKVDMFDIFRLIEEEFNYGNVSYEDITEEWLHRANTDIKNIRCVIYVSIFIKINCFMFILML